jgi:hypothetical protein
MRGRRGIIRAADAPLLVALVVLAGACSSSGTGTASSSTTAGPSGPGGSSVPARPPRTIHVPGDAPTIQGAVNASARGDLVLIQGGIYHETVEVAVAGVVIRGIDRNAVILDGDFKEENGFLVTVDNVAIENLTVRNFNSNGVFFTGTGGGKAADAGYGPVGNPSHGQTPARVLHGWRASYVTAYNNGLYGLYAFAAQGGTFDHSYASGHPDSGFYVGQCQPCDALVTDVVAEHNAVGFEGTNASGNMLVVRSAFRGNRVGITFNSQSTERLAPQGDAVVAGNLVVASDAEQSPAQAQGAYGLGIAIGGSVRNQVLRNRVTGASNAGIVVTVLDDFVPEGNHVEANVLASNAVDLVYALGSNATGGHDNCFSANTFAVSIPADIERLLPCGSAATGGPGSTRFSSAPPGIDYRNMPAPPEQPSMPEAASAPALPAPSESPRVDVGVIPVPAA